MADNKIDEAYIELRVDGLDVVKKILDQAKQTTQVFNSTLGETQSWIDRISGQMAGLKSSVQGGLSEPLDKLQRAAQQAKSLTATMGTGAVPLSAKPVPQAPTQRMNDLLDEAMGFDPFDNVTEYRSEAKAKPQEREFTPRQQAVSIVAKMQKQEKDRIETIRELIELNKELVGTDDRAASAVKEHIEALKSEQRAYEKLAEGQREFTARQQAVASVADLQKQEQDRIDKIRELTAISKDLVGTDDRAAAAIKKRIKALENEQEAYDKSSRPQREFSGTQQAVSAIASLQIKEQERIDKIRELTALNKDLVGNDDKAAAAIKKHIDALKNEQKAYESGGRGRFGNIMANIQDKIADFREKAGSVRGAISGPSTGIMQIVSRSIGPAMAAAGSAMAAVAAVVAPVAAGMAALNAVLIAAPAAFVGAAYAISKFTDALNPGLTMQLNMVMRDLTAVIGTALNPVLQAMVPAIRDFADRLLPLARDAGQYFSKLMQYMRPVMTAFNSMYQQIAGTLAPVFKLVTDIFGILGQVAGALMETIAGVLIPFKVVFEAIYEVLRPLIQVFFSIGDLLVNAGRNFRVLMAGMEGFIKGIASFLGFGDIIQASVDGWKAIGNALKSFQNWLLLAAASVAKFFGMTSFVTGMIKSLKPPDTTGLAAAQNPQYQSIEGLGKNMALQAAIATAGVGEESEQQKLDQQMLESLQSIQNNGPNLIDAINNLPGKIADALGKGAYNANPLKEPGEWLGDKVASWIYG